MVLLSALPDYEPAVTPWPPPRKPLLPHPAPVWDEPGPTRDTVWRLLTLLLESLDGRRPLPQLRTALATGVYEAMATRARVTTGRNHRLISLHTCRTSPETLELAASIREWPTGRPQSWRGRALAGRMELRNDTWLCTFLRPVGR
ncbi:Rv3235 family protein [Actinokineospora iranica]|uniref:Uncharacterized protein n=1 Tax=Actinokineospora iranica TaxID=1271860 RepID=A0A1G6SYJ8_9PSEU|nr:Rv3235 family protein [Actinokineospora iranica]SDD21819.1 hypothetical protein SAMN05216174_108252 [Actinokineospora iranica]